MTNNNNANESNVIISSSNETVANNTTSEVTAETKEVKVVKTITFIAFVEGLADTGIPCMLDSNDPSGTYLKIDRRLLKPLMTHFAEYAKRLGELVPINAPKDMPRGIRIIDGKEGNSTWEEESGILTVRVVLNFISLKKPDMKSEDLAMAVHDLGKDRTFGPDRQLVAFSLEDNNYPCPKNCQGSLLSEKEWFLYVRENEWRTNEDGTPMFPKAAYEYLLEQYQPKISLNVLEKIREYQKRFMPKAEEVAVAAKSIPAGKKFRKFQKRDYDKQPITKPEQARKDSLGSLGDNIKPTNNKARAWLKNQQVGK